MNVIARAMNRLPGHWFKGYYEENGNLCGLGAVRHELAIEFGYEDLYDGNIDCSTIYNTSVKILDKVAAEQFPERMPEDDQLCKFVAFNDHSETTLEEVLGVFEKAAVLMDESNG